MKASFLDIWKEIEPPSVEGEKRAKPVPGTNCWISKSHDNSLGLIMTSVGQPRRILELKNISIIFRSEYELSIDGMEVPLLDCLVVEMDPGCDATILASVLERMKTYENSGSYRTEMLLDVLEQVSRMFRMKRNPSKEEVIGVWGELLILERAILASQGPIEAQRRISGWESHEGRTIIDFTFPHFEGGLAIEVKTSTVGREHHILSLDQVSVPDNYGHGWLASLEIREADHISGVSVADLSSRIIDVLPGDANEVSRQAKALHDRMEMRGPACFDEKYRFILPEGGLRIIAMEDVPRPGLRPEISDVEWSVDLSEVPFLELLPFLEKANSS